MVDPFILARLEIEQVQPSPAADRGTLVRRVTLDLTGLPPTPHEVDAFLSDDAPDAYERLVDRLLASPRYGERMAADWMDAARYADSGGYQSDVPRTMWPWRDWVIAAFNRNLPFDRFTIEQLAGDLLPDAEGDPVIATGFLRNHRINDEDGIIPEEFRVEYVVDRVEVMSSVWMGLTLGCARCHDHKYDPLSQQEFYSVFAYFNSIDESGRGYGNSRPLHYFDPSIQPQIEEIDRRLFELGDAAESQYDEVLRLKKRRDELLTGSVTTMVARELAEPRETHILQRGQYDEPGAAVSPGVPAALPALPDDAPANRLGLARWLIDPQHPLTARVAVNRYWQMFFGHGLVRTPEDFGTRGEPPSHPELLDLLAVEFVRRGWDVKSLQRLIVTSGAYRQASPVSVERYRQDPEPSRGARSAPAAVGGNDP